jgi:hypothetical protein
VAEIRKLLNFSFGITPAARALAFAEIHGERAALGVEV